MSAPVETNKIRVSASDQAIAFWCNMWALTWRSVIFGSPLLLSGVPFSKVLIGCAFMAAILAFGLKVQVSRWAILGMLILRAPLKSLKTRDVFLTGYTPGAYTRSSSRPSVPRSSTGNGAKWSTLSTPGSERAPSVPVIEKATRPGRMTGYEPRALDSVEAISSTKLPLMYGTPGGGLSSSGFGDKAIKLGQTGEANFAKALHLNGALEKYATFWSVDRPDWNGGRSGADVDCVILTNLSMWMVDMKFYPGGDATYKEFGHKLYLYDNATGHQIGQPKKMSHNMEIAAQVFDSLPGAGAFKIKSRVVLIPTNSGAAEVAPSTSWPGRVRLENLDDFLKEIMAEGPFKNVGMDAEMKRTLTGLVKRS